MAAAIHCKIKKHFSYNLEWKCGQCRSEIKLCSLIAICTVHIKLLVSLIIGKDLNLVQERTG